MQTARRYWENIIIENATCELKHKSITTTTTSQESIIKVSHPQYFCDSDGIIYNYNTQKPTKWHDQKLQKNVISILNEILIPQTHRKSKYIDMYTECQFSSKLFRMRPDHPGREWRDWAYINWDGKYDIPGHLILIIDLSFLDDSAEIEVNGTFIDGPGYYVLIESMALPLEKYPPAHEMSTILHRASKMISSNNGRTNEDNHKKRKAGMNELPVEEQTVITVASVESLLETCIAVPDINTDSPNTFLFMVPRCKWSDLFIIKSLLYKIP